MHIFEKIGTFFHLLMDVNSQLLILFEVFTNGKFDKKKNLERPSEKRFLPFKLTIDTRIPIEGTFRVMRITLSKMKRSLCTINMGEARHQ